MQRYTAINFAATKRSLVKAGYMIKGWAEANGFKHKTVVTILDGYYPCRGGKVFRAVIDRLDEQGFLVISEEAA